MPNGCYRPSPTSGGRASDALLARGVLARRDRGTCANKQSRPPGNLREPAAYMSEKIARAEVDTRRFFDTIDHGHLRKFFLRTVRNGVLTRLIAKWLLMHYTKARRASGPANLLLSKGETRGVMPGRSGSASNASKAICSEFASHGETTIPPGAWSHRWSWFSFFRATRRSLRSTSSDKCL